MFRIGRVIPFAHEPEGHDHKAAHKGDNEGNAKSQKGCFDWLRALAHVAEGVPKDDYGGYDVGGIEGVGMNLCADGKVKHTTAHKDINE